VVSSAAITPAIAFVADSIGRASAKRTTNHQKVGLSAPVAVSRRPPETQARITARRPKIRYRVTPSAHLLIRQRSLVELS
jgi:Flp pilus assembly secretin CpaC